MYKFCPECGNGIGKKVEEFKCAKCGKNFYSNSRPTGTVIPFFNNEILVSVRGEEPHKGGFDYFGGFLHNGEDPLEGAVREFKEETGLVIEENDLEYLGVWLDEYEYQEDLFFTFNMIYVLPLKEKIEIKVNDDVVDFKWVSLDTPIKFAFECENKIFESIKEKYYTNG